MLSGLYSGLRTQQSGLLVLQCFFDRTLIPLRFLRFAVAEASRFGLCFARGVAACLRGDHVNATLDLGGPEVMTFSDIVRLVMDALGKHRRIVPTPVWAARPFALMQGLRRDPLVTNQQLDRVVLDNTCSLDSVEHAFGFSPVRMKDTDLRWLARLK